jgi:hypothetical protein
MVEYDNWKLNHNIVVRVVCDVKNIFLNVCAKYIGRVHDEGQFKSSKSLKGFKIWQIL